MSKDQSDTNVCTPESPDRETFTEGSVKLTGDATYPIPWGHPAGWPAVPDGTRGRFRNPGDNMLDAASDREAVIAWFARKGIDPRGDDRPTPTADAYIREVTRVLLWAAWRGQALSDLSARDVLAYKVFLVEPSPAEVWVSNDTTKRARAHPDWRPFQPGRSPKRAEYGLRVLNDLLGFLAQAGYLQANPAALVDLTVERSKETEAAASQAQRGRALTRKGWEAIKRYIDGLPFGTEEDAFQKARSRWVFHLLYTLGIRISSLRGRFGEIQPTVIDEEEVWVWSLEVKGGKRMVLPLPSSVLDEMQRFRLHLGLSRWPSPNDPVPIVPRARAHNGVDEKPLTRQALDHLTRRVIQGASRQLSEQGEEREAERLARASAHALRHTAGTELADQGASLRDAAEALGHSDVRTTQRYSRAELDRLRKVLEVRDTRW
ncbi:site-specific integrase [Thioalkalivibrio sp. ALE19]|uniref:tyrosine-type recombinase/integrase n=1 Tax=Thioalkalivibrio sp. ALE19 TaxID=1266909 RepID=UPI00041566BE|nr:site-specific integrase [Thioalkalivibrio sp. ALE19]